MRAALNIDDVSLALVQIPSFLAVGWLAGSRHRHAITRATSERERETYPGDVAEWPLYAVLAL